MKPIRLEFNAFGPFAKQEIVDFSALSESGIFLICGPTGAGKTTIFDGICFALYGEASGALRQNEDFKSDFSDPADLCFIRYSFLVRDKKFEVYRSPKQKKQKKNKDMAVIAAKAELTLPDGSVITGPAAVNARIQEILGLSAKQFKQITMLAQGDFRQFLDASSKEKQEIFRHIFDTEKFDQFTSFLETESKNAMACIEKEQQMLSFHLKSLTQREDGELSELLAAEYPVVRPILDRLDTLLKEDRGRYDKYQNDISQLEKKIAALQIETHRQNNQRLQDLENLQKEKSRLEEKTSKIEELRIRLNKLRSAKDLLPLWQKQSEQTREKQNLTELLMAKQKEQETLFQRGQDAENRLTAAQKEAAQKDRLLSAVSSLQALSPLFDESASLKKSVADLEREIAQAQKESAYAETWTACCEREQAIDALQKQVAACRSLLGMTEQKKQLLPFYQQQKERYLKNYSLFFDAQAGILASTMRENTPCPVCGSLKHPSPAPLKTNPPTQEQLRAYHDEAEKTAQEIFRLNEKINAQSAEIQNFLSEKNAFENCQPMSADEVTEIRNKKEAELQQEERQLFKLREKLAEEKRSLLHPPAFSDENGMRAHLENCRKQLNADRSMIQLQKERLAELRKRFPEGISSQEELSIKVNCLYTKMKQLDTQLESAQKNSQEIASQLRFTKQMIDENQKRLQDLQEKIASTENEFFSLLHRSFPDGEADFLQSLSQIGQIPSIEEILHQHQTAVTSLDGRIHQLKEQLINVKFINITELSEQEASLRKKIQELREQSSSVQLRISQDTSHQQQIEAIHQRIEKSEQHYRQVNDLFRVASGSNEQRVSFERYVLGFYFDAIVSFANHRLESLTGGRYLLCRKKDREKFGRSSGLDLEILDQYSGKIRPTSTLSGGESFKTALALALSLADVVQMYAGGVVIDTMFIDEGFGSLDAESLDSAVDALLSLGNDGRLVGIISHVPQLKEQIPSQIQVKAGRNGSSIQMQP